MGGLMSLVNSYQETPAVVKIRANMIPWGTLYHVRLGTSVCACDLMYGLQLVLFSSCVDSFYLYLLAIWSVWKMVSVTYLLYSICLACLLH